MKQKNAFFKTVRFKPSLVCSGKVHGAGKEITSVYGNHFCSCGKLFELTANNSTLDDFDYEYARNCGLEEQLGKEIEKMHSRREEARTKIKKQLAALKSQKILHFMNNYLFRVLNSRESSLLENGFDNDNGSDDVIVRRMLEGRNETRFKILNKMFRKGLHFVLGSMIYVCKETENPEKIHLRFLSQNYNLNGVCSLEELEKKYNKLFNTAAKEEAQVKDEKLEKMLARSDDIKKFMKEEYHEGDFGFKKIREDYYATIKIPPHCYNIRNDYYLFEPVDMGVRIPVTSKGEIGVINLANCSPVDLGTKYKHPSLQPKHEGKIRYLCYKGGNQIAIEKAVESELKSEVEGIEDPLEVKAVQIGIILMKLARGVMTKGYSHKAAPNVRLANRDHFKPVTESQYLVWVKQKQEEGHKDISIKSMKKEWGE